MDWSRYGASTGAATAASQFRILRDDETWFDRLAPAIAVAAGFAALGLFLAALRRNRIRTEGVTAALVTLAALSLLIAPATWAGITAARAQASALPAAGPNGNTDIGGSGGGGANAANRPAGFDPPANANAATGNRGGPGQDGWMSQALIDYLLANQGVATYLVAVSSAGEAERIIFQAAKVVMTMGGFSGNDPISTADSFAALVKAGKVRFVLTGGRGGFGGFMGQPDACDGGPRCSDATAGQPPMIGGPSSVTKSVTDIGQIVEASTDYGTSSTQATGENAGSALYDCQGAA